MSSKVNIKIPLFLLLLLFVFYILTSPVSKENHHMFYSLYSLGIMASTIALCLIFVIDFRVLKPKHWASASIFGLLSTNTTTPLTNTGVAIGICTFFSYLAAVTLLDSSKHRIVMHTSFKCSDIMIDLTLILLSSSIYIVFLLFVVGHGLEFQLSFSLIKNSLAPAVWEEIVFRMLLFSIIVKLNNDEKVPIVIMLLIMVVPFVLVHEIDDAVRYGLFPNGLPIPMIITATAFSLLAIKRNLLTAIGAHFFIGLIYRISYLE